MWFDAVCLHTWMRNAAAQKHMVAGTNPDKRQKQALICIIIACAQPQAPRPMRAQQQDPRSCPQQHTATPFARPPRLVGRHPTKVLTTAAPAPAAVTTPRLSLQSPCCNVRLFLFLPCRSGWWNSSRAHRSLRPLQHASWTAPKTNASPLTMIPVRHT